MRARPRSSPAALAFAFGVLASAAAARAADAGAAPPDPTRYAFPAEVRLQPDPARDRFEFKGALYALPLGTVTVDVAGQARAAWTDAAGRMFRAGAAEPALVLEVSIASVDVATAGPSGRAEVAHAGVVRDAAGVEVWRATFRGDAPIVGFDDAAVVRAFARAAAAAAKAFEAAFDASPAVAAWRAGRGLAGRTPQLPPAPRDGRGALVSYVDAGGATARGGAVGAAVRAGVSSRAWLAQLGLDASEADFGASPPFAAAVYAARLSETVLVAEGGAVWRTPWQLELRAGAGARLRTATARVDYLVDGVRRPLAITKRALGATAFAGVERTSGPLTALGLRVRVGVEARLNVGGAVEFDALASEVGVARAGAAILLGVELPHGRR